MDLNLKPFVARKLYDYFDDSTVFEKLYYIPVDFIETFDDMAERMGNVYDMRWDKPDDVIEFYKTIAPYEIDINSAKEIVMWINPDDLT